LYQNICTSKREEISVPRVYWKLPILIEDLCEVIRKSLPNTILYTIKFLWNFIFTWILYSVISFPFFVRIGVWTKSLTFAKQVFYHLSHTSSPFCSGYFETGSCFLSRPTCFKLSTIVEWQVQATKPSFFPLRWGSHKVFFFFNLGWPRTTTLPISASYLAWNDRRMPPYPDIGCYGVLQTPWPQTGLETW
jgi:hypothetical protein